MNEQEHLIVSGKGLTARTEIIPPWGWANQIINQLVVE